MLFEAVIIFFVTIKPISILSALRCHQLCPRHLYPHCLAVICVHHFHPPRDCSLGKINNYGGGWLIACASWRPQSTAVLGLYFLFLFFSRSSEAGSPVAASDTSNNLRLYKFWMIYSSWIQRLIDRITSAPISSRETTEADIKGTELGKGGTIQHWGSKIKIQPCIIIYKLMSIGKDWIRPAFSTVVTDRHLRKREEYSRFVRVGKWWRRDWDTLPHFHVHGEFSRCRVPPS